MSVMESSSAREHELHALLAQKDYELDERSKLLRKSKAVIEELQQELQACRRDLEDRDRNLSTKDQILGRQQADLRSLQERYNAQALELDCQRAEGNASQEVMTSRMAELQRCKSDFQLFRERTNDERRQAAEALSKAKEDAILQTRRAEAAERERNEQQRELDALRGKVTSLFITMKERDSTVASCKDKIVVLQADLDSCKGQLAEEEARSSSLNEDMARQRHEIRDAHDEVRILRARLDDVSREKRGALSEAAAVHESRDAVLLELQAAKVANSDLKLALDRKASEQAASAALAAERGAEKEQADRKWAESLRTATSRFEQTMLEAEGEWVDKIEELETLWSKRLDAAEQRSAAERAELEEQAEDRVQHIEAEWAARFREESHRLARELQESSERLMSDHTRMESVHQQQLRDAQSRWTAEKVTVEARWTQEKAEAEERFLALMDEARRSWKAEKEEINSRWQERVVEAERAWSDERASVEAAWKARLNEVELLAMRQQDLLRIELEERVSAVSSKLQELAQKEARREKQRHELAMQVETLRCSSDDEYSRRIEAERALQQASASFRRELEDRNIEMQTLQNGLSLSNSLIETGAGSPHKQPYRPRSPGRDLGLTSPSPRGAQGSSSSPGSSAEVERELRKLRQAREDFRATVNREDQRRAALISRMSARPQSVPAPSPEAPSSTLPGPAAGTLLRHVKASLSDQVKSAVKRLDNDLPRPSH